MRWECPIAHRVSMTVRSRGHDPHQQPIFAQWRLRTTPSEPEIEEPSGIPPASRRSSAPIAIVSWGFRLVGRWAFGFEFGLHACATPRVGLALQRRIVYPAVSHPATRTFNLIRSDRVRVTRIARSGYRYGCACLNGSRVHVRYVLSVVIMGAWMGRARRGVSWFLTMDMPFLLKIRTWVNCIDGCCARVQTSATTHPYQIWLGYHHGANQSSVRRTVDWTIQIMFFRANDPI